MIAWLLAAAVGAGAAQDEAVLGQPAAFSLERPERETLELAAGTELRERPSVDSAVVAVVDVAHQAEILERSGGFALIAWGERRGWVIVGPSVTLHGSVDPERVARACAAMGSGCHQRTMGPLTVWTDVADDTLLARIEGILVALPRALETRLGLPPSTLEGGVLVVFVERSAFQSFAALEGAPDELDGTSGDGQAAVAVSDHEEEVAELVVHELVHLAVHRSLRSPLPAWLDEGLALDLAWSRVRSDGGLELGTLAPVIASGPPGRRSVRVFGGQRAREVLLEAAKAETLPGVAHLMSSGRGSFADPRHRQLAYAAAGALARALEGHRPGTLARLLAAARGGETLLDPQKAVDVSGLDWEQIDEAFRAWIASTGGR